MTIACRVHRLYMYTCKSWGGRQSVHIYKPWGGRQSAHIYKPLGGRQSVYIYKSCLCHSNIFSQACNCHLTLCCVKHSVVYLFTSLIKC